MERSARKKAAAVKRQPAAKASATRTRKTAARKTANRKTAARKRARKSSPAKRGSAARVRTGKPAGYTTVSPYLIVAGAQQVIDFLHRAFNAGDLRRFDMPDGTVAHAEVRIDDTVVMMGDAGPEWPAAPTHLHVYVPDVDASYKRALAAGGVSVQEPTRRDGDPDKRGGVKDPGGNTWWISTQMD